MDIRRWTQAAILVGCLALVACDRQYAGTVTDKRHVPAWSEVVLRHRIVGKIMVARHVTVNHPDRWTLTIYVSHNLQQQVDVTEAEYKAINVGDDWSPRPTK